MGVTGVHGPTDVSLRDPASVWSAVSISDIWPGVSIFAVGVDIADSRSSPLRRRTVRGRLDDVSPIFVAEPNSATKG